MKNSKSNIKTKHEYNAELSITQIIRMAMTAGDANELAQILKENQPNLNELMMGGSNILQKAIEDGKKISIIKAILDYHPDNPSFALDVNELTPGDFSFTAIRLAAANERYNVVELLLEHGADPSVSNNYGSALHSAVAHRNPEITKVFLELGANPNEVIKEDYQSRQGGLMKNAAPIHIAMTGYKPLEMLKLLVAYGADINLKYNDLGVEGMDPEDMEYDEQYDRTAFEHYTLGGKDQTKVEEFNQAVSEGLAMRQEILTHSLHEEALASSESSDNEHKTKTTDKNDEKSLTSSDTASSDTSSSNQSLQGDVNKSQRATLPETSTKDEKELQTKKLKQTDTPGEKLASELINKLIAWIYDLPEWLQNKILNSTPIK